MSKRKSILRELIARDRNPFGFSVTEYALPVVLVVVSAGVILSTVNLNGLLPQYMASASGSSATGTTLNTAVQGAQGGATGTGAAHAGMPSITGFGNAMATLEGQSSPAIDNVGGNGTDGLIWALHHAIMQVPQLNTSESDGGLYVPLTVDLAMSTRSGQFENAPILAAKGNAIASYGESHTIEVTVVGGFHENQETNGEEVENLENGNNSESIQHAAEELSNIGQDGMTTEQAVQIQHLMGMFGEGGGTSSSSNYQALDEEMFLKYMDGLSRRKMNCAAYHIERFEGKKDVDYSNLIVGGIDNGCN